MQGNLKENKATIEAPIGRAKVSDFRFCVTPAGKPAVTHWDVMERFGHEATSGFRESGNRTNPSDSRAFLVDWASAVRRRHVWCQSAVLGEALGFERQWLHAMKLEFRHPRTHVWTTVKSHYPADLQHALDVMRGRHDTQDKPEV